MTTKARAFLTGVRGAVPIAAGYVPIAFSFGVAASKLGLTAFEAFMLSLIIYAGAAQFLTLALLASGASLGLSDYLDYDEPATCTLWAVPSGASSTCTKAAFCMGLGLWFDR